MSRRIVRLSPSFASLVLPAMLGAQISIPLSIKSFPGNVSVGRSGVWVGSHGVSAHIPWPTRTVSNPSRTSGSTRTPSTGTTASTSRASATRIASGVLTSAEQYEGVPYQWGGESSRGFDCSGFVQHVFGLHDIGLPRVSRDQAHAGQRVDPSLGALRPGDLMFFDAHGGDGIIDHVGIYAGDGRMIHSSSSGNGVREESLGTSRGQWFLDHMVASRRVIAGGSNLVDEAWVRSLAKSFRSGKLKLVFDPRDEAPAR